ncbi:MAG: RNA 2',3'-cyclic phosphodiesterase [Chloroflexi bacterium]|nr:RNA 2',3'-cyclic phosphodiesterase [Chloroflexota bacterium]
MLGADAGGERVFRAFVAIELPDAVREYLGHLQERLAAAGGVAWVRPEGLHVTLKFLGNVPESRISALSGSLADLAQAHHPCRLHLAPPGMFPSARRPRVVWVGLGGELEPLRELYEAVERGLAALGYPAETRPFRGHITLGRVREGAGPAQVQQLAALVQEARVPPLPIPATAITLFESRLERSGARYSRRGIFVLRPG